jgi:glutaredoxin
MPRRPIAPLLLCLGALGLGAAAQAQYKIVDPSGRVTYTDRPQPAAGAKIEPIRATGGTAPVASILPYELRQIAERYPVTLYTTEPCDPCGAGRTLLRQRGIPFTERTVRTDADRQLFQRSEAGSELPVVRIGTQQLRGFSEAEWVSYLDAAGYPKESRLPPSYRAPEPTALAPVQPAAPRAQAAPAANPAPAQLPPALETAPNGIRF